MNVSGLTDEDKEKILRIYREDGLSFTYGTRKFKNITGKKISTGLFSRVIKEFEEKEDASIVRKREDYSQAYPEEVKEYIKCVYCDSQDVFVKHIPEKVKEKYGIEITEVVAKNILQRMGVTFKKKGGYV